MEGKWSSSVRDVRSVDRVLAALDGAGRARYAKHHINDPDDLEQQMTRWGQKQHERFNIGYVALHGAPSKVFVGRRAVDLFDLGTRLPRAPLKKKALHFGSCSVLDISSKERQELRKALGVRVLTGFTTDVDWFESMAFELILFDALTSYRRIDAADNYLKKHHRAFARRLGFVMIRES